jgi:beta-galactosidase
VSNGGTVLMTAFSAKLDEHGQWFETPLPGRLNDVFGLKTNAFYQVGPTLQFELDGKAIDTGSHYYEVLEPSTATILMRFKNTADHSPAVTLNQFGKGNAIYLATESKASALEPVLNHLYKMAGIAPGPQTPEGVYARVVDGRTLYVNTTRQQKKILIVGRKKGIITNRVYDGAVILDPQEADLLQ